MFLATPSEGGEVMWRENGEEEIPEHKFFSDVCVEDSWSKIAISVTSGSFPFFRHLSFETTTQLLVLFL